MNKPLVFNYREYEEAKEQIKILEGKVDKLQHEKRNLEIRCRIAEMNAKELNAMILKELKELREVIEKNGEVPFKTFCGVDIKEAVEVIQKYKDIKERSKNWFEQMEICDGCVHLWAGRCLDFNNGCENGSMKRTSWDKEIEE